MAHPEKLHDDGSPADRGLVSSGQPKLVNDQDARLRAPLKELGAVSPLLVDEGRFGRPHDAR